MFFVELCVAISLEVSEQSAKRSNETLMLMFHLPVVRGIKVA